MPREKTADFRQKKIIAGPDNEKVDKTSCWIKKEKSLNTWCSQNPSIVSPLNRKTNEMENVRPSVGC